MQRNLMFIKLKKERVVQCDLEIGKHIEVELILQMTQVDPKLRPSSIEILNDWLPKWNQ